MKPSELIADCPLPPGHEAEFRLMLRIFCRHAADHSYELTLSTGQRVLDPLDFKRFLGECVEAINFPGKFTPRDHTCPDCHHEHESRDECKKYLGEGRFCPCESKVTA